MKTLGIYMIVALCFVVFPANAANYDSSYTSIKSKNCKVLRSHHMGGTLSCKGFSNIKVQLEEDDLRQSLTLIRKGKRYPLNFWSNVTNEFSQLGSVIEWRYKKGRRGKRGKLKGIITRLNAEHSNNQTTSYLVVVKITSKQMCVVGKIRPQAKQNQKARRMLERSYKMRCL